MSTAKGKQLGGERGVRIQNQRETLGSSSRDTTQPSQTQVMDTRGSTRLSRWTGNQRPEYNGKIRIEKEQCSKIKRWQSGRGGVRIQSIKENYRYIKHLTTVVRGLV